MVLSNQQKNQHLLWRAGFGAMAEDLGALGHLSPARLYKSLAKSSSGTPEQLDVADNMFRGLMMGVNDAVNMQKKELSAEGKKAFRKQSQQDIKSLNLAWLDEMVNSKAQLREKMALFWHGHFASRNLNIFYQQLLLNVIRQHALGNFSDLLTEVSKSAAMINFLNNNQNRKDHANENFAREVMELFTLGRGNYTESDVKEAARAFTGWGADLRGDFVFRKNQHDDGVKTVLGQSGRFDGDDVLQVLLSQRQTARFITKKIYRFFVDDKPDDERINQLAEKFYSSHYDIGQLMENIFTADWFYDPVHVGNRIKSPVELIVGIRRILPMEIANPEVQLLLQRLLGQLLFYPPNVAGWPGGFSWIDSSSLMFRLRIPQMIYEGDEFRLQPKPDDDQMMGMKDPGGAGQKKGARENKNGQAFRASIQWPAYLHQFESVETEQLAPVITGYLLSPAGAPPSAAVLNKYIDQSSRDQLIKTLTIRTMSTPQFQLC